LRKIKVSASDNGQHNNRGSSAKVEKADPGYNSKIFVSHLELNNVEPRRTTVDRIVSSLALNVTFNCSED